MTRASLLARDTRGSTIVEFAVLAPTLLLMLLAGMELAYQSYVTSLLEGEVQKAARDSAIQGGAEATATIDATVQRQVEAVVRNATFSSQRLSYSSFLAAKPERFTDINANNIRDPGECFDDVNGNRVWDADPGRAGQGGANDVTLYRMTMTYPRIFPLAGMLGLANVNTITVQTAMKNQPYASQNMPALATICT
jgi:hypothetical protein